MLQLALLPIKILPLETLSASTSILLHFEKQHACSSSIHSKLYVSFTLLHFCSLLTEIDLQPLRACKLFDSQNSQTLSPNFLSLKSQPSLLLPVFSSLCKTLSSSTCTSGSSMHSPTVNTVALLGQKLVLSFSNHILARFEGAQILSAHGTGLNPAPSKELGSSLSTIAALLSLNQFPDNYRRHPLSQASWWRRMRRSHWWGRSKKHCPHWPV
jgi:hypothetical protein